MSFTSKQIAFIDSFSVQKKLAEKLDVPVQDLVQIIEDYDCIDDQASKAVVDEKAHAGVPVPAQQQ